MKTPKGLRLHIGIFGRRNVGKSSLLNRVTHQNVSIVSSEKGTTTDPVEKAMELLPLGPVLFIDTAGIDDEGALGALRIERTAAVYERCDLGLLVTDGVWGAFERSIETEFVARHIPWIAVLNQADRCDYSALKREFDERKVSYVETSAIGDIGWGRVAMCDNESPDVSDGIEALQQKIIELAPSDFLDSRRIIADLLPGENRHVLLVIPIDKEAPKGRLIMPQVQTIRDILDAHATCTICSEDNVSQTLALLREPPAIVVTDSQAFEKVSKQVPDDIALTGFSVLFARFKGELTTMAAGARALMQLKPGDKVLIAEACTHHPIQDDIGRTKIPNWIRKNICSDVVIDFVSGSEFPRNLAEYSVIIHCGACMWTRRQVLGRIRQATAQGVPITNYGMAIAAMHHILDRAMKIFEV